MIRMICEDCRTIYYSAAARTMVARDERCEKCGGRLVIDEPGNARRRTVGAGSANGPESDGEPTG